MTVCIVINGNNELYVIGTFISLDVVATLVVAALGGARTGVFAVARVVVEKVVHDERRNDVSW